MFASRSPQELDPRVPTSWFARSRTRSPESAAGRYRAGREVSEATLAWSGTSWDGWTTKGLGISVETIHKLNLEKKHAHTIRAHRFPHISLFTFVQNLSHWKPLFLLLRAMN